MNFDNESTTEIQPVEAQTARPLNDAWFVASCVLLPILWGVLVHALFKRIRGRNTSHGQSEADWPDYQI